jgi:hypothetical protein
LRHAQKISARGCFEQALGWKGFSAIMIFLNLTTLAEIR